MIRARSVHGVAQALTLERSYISFYAHGDVRGNDDSLHYHLCSSQNRVPDTVLAKYRSEYACHCEANCLAEETDHRIYEDEPRLR